MICPNCNKDYKDVPEGRIPGHFYRSDDHYYRAFRRFGVYCTNCGFVAEMITKPTGDPYKKRDLGKKDRITIDMFDDEFEKPIIKPIKKNDLRKSKRTRRKV